MKNRIRRKIVDFIKNQLEKVLSIMAHRHEIKKCKNPKRVEIYSKVALTEEEKNKIDNLYVQNYGKKIPYTWHKHFKAFTGRFDETYFPELLYIPEFEKYMNRDKRYNYVFSDKNLLPYIASAAGVKTPINIISCVNGIYRNGDCGVITRDKAIDILSNIGQVFIKPTVDSCSGQKCAIINIENGSDKISGRDIGEIIKEMGRNFAVQEIVVCHESIAKIHPQSVNTFRIITYIWKSEIKVIPAIMRIGRGGKCVDNAHAGGMFIAIENDGTLHKTAFTEFKEEYDFHPDTNVLYEGYKIELFPEVLETAKKMHEKIPQIGVVNWDFTIDENGDPVIIEMNINSGSIWLMQMAHGKGPFGVDTPDVLKWMDLMGKTKPSERDKYAFGNME